MEKNNLEKNDSKECVLMLSGGLDSRLALKIMQEQGFKISVLFFKLPFGAGCCSLLKDVIDFASENKCKMEVFDCTKKDLLKEYINILKKPKHNTGKGVNPCIDCRIFMLKHAREYADKKGISLIVTGEVLGERPMSQMRKSSKIIEEESGLQGRLLRPLSARLFPETEAEKTNLVDREKLYAIQGRKRDKQIELAKKYNINYPHPAGGCLLCEKQLKKRFSKFLEKDLINEDNLPLINIGRHFLIPLEENKKIPEKEIWVIVGRDEVENGIIESFGNTKEKDSFKQVISSDIGKPAVYLKIIYNLKKETSKEKGKEYNKKNSEEEIAKEKALELQKVYSTGSLEEERNKFDKWKL